MDKRVLMQYIEYMESSVDSDAIIGLRGAQSFLKEFDLNIEQVLMYVADHYQNIKTVEQPAVEEKAASPEDNVIASGEIPEFKSNAGGIIRVVFSNGAANNCILPACAANDAEHIALAMKDAVVAAIINKTHIKIKLFDAKGDDGKVVETILRTEYDREDMQPVNLWSGTKGEAGTVASVLRPFIKEALPELVA